MNKQELIEKLREHGAWCTECHDINGKKDRYVKAAKVRELIEQMEEPKQDKPAVKQFVADWYEGHKWDLEGNIFTIAVDIYNKGDRTDFEKWFNDSDTKPVETLIKMKLFGYTVEQPKWRVIKNGEGECVYELRLAYTDTTMINTGKRGIDPLTFTNLKKAEAVATLVEGSVEEV